MIAIKAITLAEVKTFCMAMAHLTLAQFTNVRKPEIELIRVEHTKTWWNAGHALHFYGTHIQTAAWVALKAP